MLMPLSFLRHYFAAALRAVRSMLDAAFRLSLHAAALRYAATPAVNFALLIHTMSVDMLLHVHYVILFMRFYIDADAAARQLFLRRRRFAADA